MKQGLLIFTYTLFAISCFHDKTKSAIEQIWIKDGRYIYYHPTILTFYETTGGSTVIKTDYYDLHKEVNKFKWYLKLDRLIFQDSAKNTYKYIIHELTTDSMIIESIAKDSFQFETGFIADSIYSSKKTTYYSISSTGGKFTKAQLDKQLINNSFIFKFTLHNKLYNYDFVTKTRCINKFDSINFQLEYWETENIEDEIFLFIKYPIWTGVFHLLQIHDDSLSFEYVYNGINNAFLIKKAHPETSKKDKLIGKWDSFPDSQNNVSPPPPILTNKNKKFIYGESYNFEADNTYTTQKGYKNKQGFWKFSKSGKYILLDSLKSRKDIISIEFKNRNLFSLLHYSSEEAETKIIELYKN